MDKENLGLELVQMALSSDHESIIDLGKQRGIGAGAGDKMKRPYELKVRAGYKPIISYKSQEWIAYMVWVSQNIWLWSSHYIGWFPGVIIFSGSSIGC